MADKNGIDGIREESFALTHHPANAQQPQLHTRTDRCVAKLLFYNPSSLYIGSQVPPISLTTPFFADCTTKYSNTKRSESSNRIASHRQTNFSSTTIPVVSRSAAASSNEGVLHLACYVHTYMCIYATTHPLPLNYGDATTTTRPVLNT